MIPHLKHWLLLRSTLPVEAYAIGGIQQILRDIASRDVHQDVPGHHLGERGAATHSARAGEASALHGADALDWLVDGQGQCGGRRHHLCGGTHSQMYITDSQMYSTCVQN